MLSNLIKQVVNAKAVRKVITKIFMSYVEELMCDEENIVLAIRKLKGKELIISLILNGKFIRNLTDNEIEQRI